MDSEKNQEQLEKDSTVNVEQPNQQDNKLSYEDLEKSYKFTQSELSKTKNELSWYKEKGVEIDEVKQKAELVEKAEQVKKEEEVFNAFKTEFTSLSETQLKSIRDLNSLHPEKSFEETARHYDMINDAQLEKSKYGKSIMWNNIWVKQKSSEEKIEISDRARRIHNIKSPERIAEIKDKFGL